MQLYAEQAKVVKREAADQASIDSVCNKLKQKIQDLAKRGKVTLSTHSGCPDTPAEKKKGITPKAEKSILDLTEGSFSGVCKNKAKGNSHKFDNTV